MCIECLGRYTQGKIILCRFQVYSCQKSKHHCVFKCQCMEKAERHTCVDNISWAQTQNHNLTLCERIIITAIQLKHTHAKNCTNIHKNQSETNETTAMQLIRDLHPFPLCCSLAFSTHPQLYPSLAWLMKLHSPRCNCIMEVTEEPKQHGIMVSAVRG